MAEPIGAAKHTVNSEVDLSNESPERQLALARKQSLVKILSPETYGQDVPTLLKRRLFWPGTPVKTSKKRNKKDEKMPAVITSEKWQEMEGKKRREEKIELEKEERKRMRKEKKNAKSLKKNCL